MRDAATAINREDVSTESTAMSSVEEGQTPLDDAFGWRELRLEQRREALKDTTFKFNLHTYYLDRNKFDGSVSEAWAIGGWRARFCPYQATCELCHNDF